MRVRAKLTTHHGSAERRANLLTEFLKAHNYVYRSRDAEPGTFAHQRRAHLFGQIPTRRIRPGLTPTLHQVPGPLVDLTAPRNSFRQLFPSSSDGQSIRLLIGGS